MAWRGSALSLVLLCLALALALALAPAARGAGAFALSFAAATPPARSGRRAGDGAAEAEAAKAQAWTSPQAAPAPAFAGAASSHALLLSAAACGLCLLQQHRRSLWGVAQRARGGEAAVKSMAPCDQWIPELDLPAFGKEVRELGERLKAAQGAEDQAHLHKMMLWSRACAVFGLATMWLGPNPLTVVALSLWTHSAWTMMGHHVSHGGYNRTDKSGQYNSRGFAQGSLRRRVLDWFDWMLPEAWNVEHNQLHHYRLGEEADPDLLERNASVWKGAERYTMPFLSMLLWKWAYYAPNTYKELKVTEMRKKGQQLPEGFDPMAPLTVGDLMAGKGNGVFSFGEFLQRVVGPYFLFRFLLLPLPFLIGGPQLFLNAVCNLVLADVVSNIHGFVVIVTNHAGNDLYKFATGCKPKSPTFYLRAITSSANFSTGGDVNDFLHGWLNYQIEHHCWPDLSMLAYQRGKPELQAICERHGVPYVQENVFVRLKKTLDIATGRATMRQYPADLESKDDMMVWTNERVIRVAA